MQGTRQQRTRHDSDDLPTGNIKCSLSMLIPHVPTGRALRTVLARLSRSLGHKDSGQRNGRHSMKKCTKSNHAYCGCSHGKAVVVAASFQTQAYRIDTLNSKPLPGQASVAILTDAHRAAPSHKGSSSSQAQQQN